MARKKKEFNPKDHRYVVNIKTGGAHIATEMILSNLHKKNNKDLRLMPDGWVPGDDVAADNEVAAATFTDDQLQAMVAKIAQRSGMSEEDARLVVAESTGQAPTPSDEVTGLSDANEVQEIIAVIAEMDPKDEEQFTEGGKPDAKYITSVLGKRISAAQRDEAWDAYKG